MDDIIIGQLTGREAHLPDGRKVFAALLDEERIAFRLSGGRDDLSFSLPMQAFSAMNQLVVELLTEEEE